jgi:hypothetical protein
MVLDFIQLAPSMHKVGANKAPVHVVVAPKDTQSIAPWDWRDVVVETVLRRVCVSLGVGVGVKLTSRRVTINVSFRGGDGEGGWYPLASHHLLLANSQRSKTGQFGIIEGRRRQQWRRLGIC